MINDPGVLPAKTIFLTLTRTEVLAVDSVTKDSVTVRVRALTVPVTVKIPLLAEVPVILILSPDKIPSVTNEPVEQVMVLPEKLILRPVEEKV